MTTISEASGTAGTITFGGETFNVKPLSIKDWSLLRNRIVQSRGNPISMINLMIQQNGQGGRAVRDAAAGCMEGVRTWNDVTYADVDEFLDTPEGSVFLVYLQIRENDVTKITNDYVWDLLNAEAEAKGWDIYEAIRQMRLTSSQAAAIADGDPAGN